MTKRNLMAALLALLLIAGVAGCRREELAELPETSAESASEIEIEVVDDAMHWDYPDADPDLLELCRTIFADPARVSVQTDQTIYHDDGLDVRVTADLLERIFRLLLEEPSRQEDRFETQEQTTEILGVQIEIEQEEDQPWNYTGMELRELVEDGMALFFRFDYERPAYIYNGDIFERIGAIVSDYVYTASYEIDGEYVCLQADYTRLDDYWYGERVSDGNVIVVEWKAYARDGETRDGVSSVFEVLDLVTGERQFEFEVPQRVLGLERLSGGEWDFRILCQDRVLYRKMTDAEAEYSYRLPESVVVAVGESFDPLYDVDLENGRLAWQGEDGVYLSDLEGNNPVRVLSNDDLEAQIREVDEYREEPYSNFTVNYTRPAFFAGRLLAYGEMQGGDPMFVSIAAQDLAGGETDYYVDVFAWLSGVPRKFGQGNLAYWGKDGIEMLDLGTGERTTLEVSIHEDYTVDYQTLFGVSQTRDSEGYTLQQLKRYPIEDRSRKTTLITLSSHQFGLIIQDVLEDYVICRCDTADGEVIIAIPWR